MLADGGEGVSDLGAVRDHEAWFGPVASDSTAFRVVDRIASEPCQLELLRVAHARARGRFWELHGVPERLDLALAQIPDRHIETIAILVVADSASATHGLVNYCREASRSGGPGFRHVTTQPALGRTEVTMSPVPSTSARAPSAEYRRSIGAENRSNWSLTHTPIG
jgi:hypothetical protein